MVKAASLAAIGAVCLSAVAMSAMNQSQPSLHGVYYGFRVDQLNNKVKADHYTFLADGRAFRGYPTEGLGESHRRRQAGDSRDLHPHDRSRGRGEPRGQRDG